MSINNNQKIAVVTGANRGIGFEICRQLAQNGFLVVLTSRDEKKGLAACEKLHKEDKAVRYFKLDVIHSASVMALKDFLQKEFGRCDVLINNAGIFPDINDHGSGEWPSIFNSHVDVIQEAMETNVYGPLHLCQAVIPLMKKNNFGRIVNMSSGMGQLSDMNGGCPGYRISKTSLNALTRIFSDELKGTNILINSMCPGWVKTEMGGPEATREIPEGADTAVWLATLPDGGPSGKFFRDRKEIKW